jgi:hypothetical protein
VTPTSSLAEKVLIGTVRDVDVAGITKAVTTGAAFAGGITGSGLAVNEAVALRPWLTLTVQVLAVPEQSPLQPVKLLPVVATAVSVTLVPLGTLKLQTLPQ